MKNSALPPVPGPIERDRTCLRCRRGPELAPAELELVFNISAESEVVHGVGICPGVGEFEHVLELMQTGQVDDCLAVQRVA